MPLSPVIVNCTCPDLDIILIRIARARLSTFNFVSDSMKLGIITRIVLRDLWVLDGPARCPALPAPFSESYPAAL
jgi:hypothetical protein